MLINENITIFACNDVSFCRKRRKQNKPLFIDYTYLSEAVCLYPIDYYALTLFSFPIPKPLFAYCRHRSNPFYLRQLPSKPSSFKPPEAYLVSFDWYHYFIRFTNSCHFVRSKRNKL